MMRAEMLFRFQSLDNQSGRRGISQGGINSISSFARAIQALIFSVPQMFPDTACRFSAHITVILTASALPATGIAGE
jgi:hypothetical protein